MNIGWKDATQFAFLLQTAVAGSIDLRTYVSLFTSADGRIYLSLPALGVEKTWLLKDLLRAGERLSGMFFISPFCIRKINWNSNCIENN